MIVSHKHQFIFIKTKKTAGTSLEIALSRYCGTADIITPLPEPDRTLRKEFGGRSEQNCEIPQRNYTLREWAKYIARGEQATCYNHMRAGRIRWLVGRRIWKRYYKFTLERNPWDKAISLYYWRTRNLDERPEFSDFLRSSRAHKLSNFKLYSIFGRVAVDTVYRYEELGAALRNIEHTVGLPGTLEMPETKTGHRKERAHYSEFINDEDRQYIARRCKREIDLLNYAFHTRGE